MKVCIVNENQYLCKICQMICAMNEINRLKVVLVEQKRTGKWLAEVLGMNAATISRWCSNTNQPSMETMRKIAKLLDVDVKDLLISTKK